MISGHASQELKLRVTFNLWTMQKPMPVSEDLSLQLKNTDPILSMNLFGFLKANHQNFW
jgi:hypothetical protein